MQFFKSFSLTIAVLSLIFVLVILLTPDKYRRQMQIVLSVILSLTLSALLVGADFSDFSAFANNYKLDESGISSQDKMILEELEGKLSEHIKTILDENEIAAEKITVKTNIDGDRCIFISKISLTIKEESKASITKAVIEKNIGKTEVEIFVAGDVNGT